MFGNLFGGSTFLEPELEAWQLETWAWLMRNLGGVAALKRRPLVTPTGAFFPPSGGASGHDKAMHGLDCVKRAMGMAAWDCDLVRVERPEPSQRVGEFWTLQPEGGQALATFQVSDGRAIISYAAELTAQPSQLVATFAHELAHYLLATIAEPAPGGDEAHELATELAVAYAGMGVMAANQAFTFEQHQDAFSQGWRSQRRGYFSERSWAFAIAVFLALTDRIGEAGPWLKPSVADMVKSAERYLRKQPQRLAELRPLA